MGKRRKSGKVAIGDAVRQLPERVAEASARSAKLNELKSQLAQMADALSRSEKEIQTNSMQLSEATAESERRNRELNGLRASLAKLQADLGSTRAIVSRLERERDEAREEVKRLDADLKGIRSTRVWRVAQRLASAVRMAQGALERLGIRSIRPEARMAHLVSSSHLFDRDWYLAQNPDVAAHGVDPALHYVLHGAAEGRDPGPGFSTQWYLDKHGDVAAAGMNPLIHFVLHGMAEGRGIKPSSAAQDVRAEGSSPLPTEPPDMAAEPLSLAAPQLQDTACAVQNHMAHRDGHASLELSGVNLGLASIPQSDTEEAWTVIADFARVLDAFCRLYGIEPGEAIGCKIGDLQLDIAAKLDGVDSAACSMVSFKNGTMKETIADIWYVNDLDLKVRFDCELGSRGQPGVARFFQYEISSRGKLVQIGESVLYGRGVDFADVALTNAFLPVLMTLATPEARLLSASLLPFPSLCRGGVHYGELCAVGRGPSYLENLQTVSRSLLGEMLGGSATAPDFSIARIEIDLQGAIGSERIFSTEIREWLACIMRVTVGPANSAAIASPKVRAHLEQSLAPIPLAHRKDLAEQIAARERVGVVAVILPPDGVPSLHGLVSRGLCIGSGMTRAAGSFVVAESSTARPRWAVSIPPMGEELLALQPASASISYPIVTRLAPDGNAVHAKDINGVPLAVRFCEMRNRHPASLIMPAAPDATGPLLRRVTAGAGDEAATVSVLLGSSRQAKDAFAALVESMKLQTMAESVEVIAVVDAGQAAASQAAKNVLQRYFPGKYRLVEQPSGTSRNARINHAGEHAAGKFLLIAGAGIALHDPRTLETLCTMADHDKVASAGCVLLQTAVVKEAQSAAFRSGGIFPSCSLHPPEAAFSEPDCHTAFPFATYPVAGNSSALFMTRSDIWRRLGGFDATSFPDVHGDIEYATRAIANGFFHLCTSVVSAELSDRDFGAPYSDVALPSSIATGTRRNIAAPASLLKGLNG